jgi:hypothetical protein
MSDNHGLLVQIPDAALMEEEQLLEFLCPFTAETNHEWNYDWCVENWGTKWDIFDVDSLRATPLMDNTYTYTFDKQPHEEMPCQLVDEWGIDVDYDYFIMNADDDELSDDQKEWRKMLREDMQKEYGNG